MPYREREQIQISDLMVAVHAVEIDGAVIAQRHIIGPELVVERRAGARQLCVFALQPQRAAPAIAGLVKHADYTICHQRAGRDGNARRFEQRVTLCRCDTGIVKQRYPDIDVQQQVAQIGRRGGSGHIMDSLLLNR